MLIDLRRAIDRTRRRLHRLRSERAARPIDRPPFGEEWISDFLPHYRTSDLSQLHRDLASDLRELTTLRGQRRNYIAPRGSAKTTWVSKGYPLYCALEAIEPLILLLAETGEQSKAYLDSIKQELEGNPKIAASYPNAAGKGPVWRASRIRLRNGCEIIARGSGGRILGVTARNRRPTLVIVDDGNERGDAYSPTKRQRKLDWFARDVLPVGEPGTNIVVAGTAIHREAIVCDLERTGWRTRSYKAIEREPDRQDLWQEWERLLTDLSDPKRDETARAFYEQRRSDMHAGAELLWPERLTLYDLMVYRVRHGEPAFRSEYQSDPGSPEGAEWPAELFDRPDFWFDAWPQDVELGVIALDPSKGADAKAGDYQAHAVVGLHKGTLYVDAELRHETPEAMCLRTCSLAKEWAKRQGKPVHAAILEDNGTMGLLRVAIQLAQKEASILLPWQCLTQSDPKPLRIRAVSAYLATGRIRVRNTPGGRMLVEQWREFPFGSHDDGPDAVATAIRYLEQLTAGG